MTQELKQKLTKDIVILVLVTIILAMSLWLWGFYMVNIVNQQAYDEKCIEANEWKEGYYRVATEADNLITFQEQYFYPDDIYRKLQEEGMPDSLSYMFTQVAIVESGYGLNSQIANENHNYWGFRDEKDCSKHKRFRSNEEAIAFMVRNFNPKDLCIDKYLWLQNSLRWNPNKRYIKKVKSIKF